MIRYYPKLHFVLLVILFQCASPAQKENENAGDTTSTPSATTVSAPAESSEEMPDEDAELYDADPNSLALDEFAKHPFPSDYPYIKNFLREEGIAFTILTEDTIHSEQRSIEFDSSRIDFLDSDDNFQEELGDLICSSDIRSDKFQFNQNVTIGMIQDDFLSWAGVAESLLTKEEDLSYYEHKVSWGEDEGYWKVIFWFRAGILVRIQSEISPCYYDYGD